MWMKTWAAVVVGVLGLLVGCSREVGLGEKRVLALGDSYTIGEGVGESERWPVQLVGLLRNEGVKVGEVRIVARTGWTVRELMAGMEAEGGEVMTGKWDLVTVLIGVNDQYRAGSVGVFRTGFKELMGRAVKLAGGDGGRVVVVSIPDWGATPFGVRSGREAGEVALQIDAFNAVCKEEAAAVGAEWVEITEESRKVGDRPGWVAGDGLHPSGAMYGQWAAAALGAAKRGLAR